MEPSSSSFQKVRSQHDSGSGIQAVVGFEDDARRLVEQLLGGKKQLQFISVVGMAGLGKTTLVKKVFDEPSVVYHFYVRAWTTVTQQPKKRDLVLGILKSGFNAGTEDSDDMELSLMLKRRLSGQRYLVVLDDIWDSKDWNDLMLCFPDDNVGSRIVFTTRLADVPLQVQSGCYQHPLRFLNEKESWDLLRYKVFLDEACPSSLVEIGKQIASKCHGLPLSIVVIAGVLANDRTAQWWSQVAQDMNSIASTAPEQYMDTLVLSYNHLPDHLKPCFLYFTAFPEDYEIPAWKLILLWVAEGFVKIQTTEYNSEDERNMLEEVAAHYLKDLISRSLIIISKRRSNGGIKSCIVHDALRDLCIRKADEENFMHHIPNISEYFHSIVETPKAFLVQRLYSRENYTEGFFSPPQGNFCFPKDTPNVQTILAYNGSGKSYVKVMYINSYNLNILLVFKCLRVMDISSIGIDRIPMAIESLQQLRYLALCIEACFGGTSLRKLKHLETFIVRSQYKSVLPDGLLECYKLRHLILKGNFRCITQLDDLETLSSLQTLSLPISLADVEKILGVTPNVRKLTLSKDLYLSWRSLTIPNLAKLQYLESLSLRNNLGRSSSDELVFRELSSPSMFPITLKKLTLVCTFLKWDEMKKIGMLPNLEVLKLQYQAFRGEHWETHDGGFCRLKHLSFKFMRIVKWSAYSDQFPNLQHLKLDECVKLEEIPIAIGDIYTLDMIEIRNCNPAVVKSAHRIKKDQMNKGNDLLKVSIFQE
ncbi:hypothetical protein DCAR_0727033 [Daucus carota subsp. sativus]|uniref:NB-ARC domain-containing protein n=1 Tax=Daucus carota subsp. sativus TaxID=79200 RepID=A0AAF0XGV6_DAUCS|nr:PREDICTED: putative late blight resistance protein homolog R1B-16 isoform X2 [Daucus carota subsp. sativus]WOH07600.1 hypothetical protein DCAR_0727033 [Daucus carota subsp. sativus]